MTKCWNKGGCIYNSNNSPKYKKCRWESYSRLQCRIDYLRKYKSKLEEVNMSKIKIWERRFALDTIKEPRRVKARKEYKCDTCDKIISIGEEHTVATYKDGYIYTWRTCDRCKPYVDEAFSNKDYDWSDGMGWQDFHDYMYEKHRDIAIKWWQSIKQN